MASKTKPTKSATDAANLNLKTQEGRDALDALVAKELKSAGKGGALGATLLAGIGGINPPQLRASLARLKDAGKVVQSGVTRNTLYALT